MSVSENRMVCPKTGLIRYPEVTAKIDTEAMRRGAAESNPRSGASAQKCQHCGGWHIHIPSKVRWRNRQIKRDNKQAAQLNAERKKKGLGELPRTVEAVVAQLPPVLRAEAWANLADANNHDQSRERINRWWETAVRWPQDPYAGPEPLTPDQFRSAFPKVEAPWAEAPKNESNQDAVLERRLAERRKKGERFVEWLEDLLADEKAYLERLDGADNEWGLPL